MAPYDVDREFVQRGFTWFKLLKAKEITDKWDRERKTGEVFKDRKKKEARC